jgi:hypothetical protein
MNKFITIKGKKVVKNGVNAEGPWELTVMQDQDGLEFSTFKGEAYQVGATYEIVYTEQASGQYVRRTITSAIPKKTNLAELPVKTDKFAKPIATQNAEEIIGLLKEILRLAQENNEALSVLVPNKPKREIKAEDLPF